MLPLYRRLAEYIASGETVAVATIVAVRGSAPREAGAKMIIHPLGQHVGTVGGGTVEDQVMRFARGVLTTGRAATVHVDLTEEISMDAQGVCGGTVDVFVEPVGPAASGMDARIAALGQAMAERRPVALVTVVEGSKAGNQAVVWLDEAPSNSLGLGELEPAVVDAARQALTDRQHRLLRYPDSGMAVFVEVQKPAPQLVIVGAGHVALPLARMAAMCDFAVTVLDDRVLFANRERFPDAEQVIAAPLRETLRDLPIHRDTYVVLVNRGHAFDVECLVEVLDRPAAYIGMIGSKRHVAAVFGLLEGEMGVDPAKFDRVRTPIGIDIGAKTPAEIAVCIMAEVISVLRGVDTPSLSDTRRKRLLAAQPSGTP